MASGISFTPATRSPLMKTSSLQIRTPEGIVFSQLLAGPVTRFCAWFVDLLCIMTVLILLSFLFSLLQLISANLAGALYLITYFVVSIGYAILCEWKWRGQTIGK